MRSNLVRVVGLVAVVLVVATFAARGEQPRFDLKEAQQDIEIMKGILRTTLTFAVEELETTSTRTEWSHTPIDGYYLVGQGAVFVVSLPGLRDPRFATWNSVEGVALEDLRRERVAGYEDALLARSEADPEPVPEPDSEDEEGERRGRRRSEARGTTPEAESYRALGRTYRVESEEQRKERAEIREKQLAEYQTMLRTLADRLVDTLGRHGDALARVAPDEYVTLILSPGHGGYTSFFGEQSALPREVISVERSAVTAFKAGKLSRTEFETKVLHYQN